MRRAADGARSLWMPDGAGEQDAGEVRTEPIAQRQDLAMIIETGCGHQIFATRRKPQSLMCRRTRPVPIGEPYAFAREASAGLLSFAWSEDIAPCGIHCIYDSVAAGNLHWSVEDSASVGLDALDGCIEVRTREEIAQDGGTFAIWEVCSSAPPIMPIGRLKTWYLPISPMSIVSLGCQRRPRCRTSSRPRCRVVISSLPLRLAHPRVPVAASLLSI